MRKSSMLILVVAMACCFAIMAGSSNSVFADDAVEQDILNRVKKIRRILNTKVIPRLDECCPGAGVAKTGQTTSYATGDDGELQMGTPWPNPRFTDNQDGTVTDNLTGLIWLKNANCFGQRTWGDALTDCNTLAAPNCGLSDDSIAGDWRLPNIRELHSLTHYGIFLPAVSDTAGTGQWSEGDPFTSVQSFYYWSSTAYESNTGIAWYVGMADGNVHPLNKAYDRHVWPVRAGN